MLDDCELIFPADDMEATYASYVEELRHRDELPVPFVLRLEAPTFGELLQQLRGFSHGVDVREGFVEHTTYWLVDRERRLLGVSNLRHRLTPGLLNGGGHIGFGVRPSERGKGYATRMLALTLRQAKKMGIERAMLSCFDTNVASAAVIEKNGGVFESTFTDDGGVVMQRFWIDLVG